MAEPDWIARFLGGIGTVSGLATAGFTAWWYLREARRQAETDIPVVETSQSYKRDGYTCSDVTVRNVSPTTVTIERISLVKPRKTAIYRGQNEMIGAPNIYGDVEFVFRENVNGTIELNNNILPNGIVEIGRSDTFRTTIGIKDTDLKDRSFTVNVVLSWQHPRPQSRRYRRTI